MPNLITHPFFETISRLRNNEELLVYEKPGKITVEDEKDVRDFLEAEWDNECLEYPYTPPLFDGDAAVWAARTVYISAQLLLYRSHRVEDIAAWLPGYNGAITASAVLSADLCLRILPMLFNHAQVIDPDDILLATMEQQLHVWHYSGIGSKHQEHLPDLTTIKQNKTCLQLYADRVIHYKNRQLANHPDLKPTIMASMGAYAGNYWKELSL